MGWTGYHGDSRQIAQARLAKARAGDPQALQDLYTAARPGGWRPDDRNSAIEAWNQLNPDTSDDLPLMKNPHGFLGDVGKGLGSVLKIAGPLAGALIPGVGVLGAGLIGAAGSAAGGALHGDKFDLKDTLLAGGAAGLGNKVLGNGLGGGSSNWGFGSTPSRVGPIGGGPAAGEPGFVPGSNGGGGGGLDRFGGIGEILQKYGPLALGAAGVFQNASDQGRANDLRDQGIKYATDDWNQRAPLRSSAQQRLLAPMPAKRDLSSTYDDPTDPYKRPRVAPMSAGGY